MEAMADLVHKLESVTGLDWVQWLLGAAPLLGVFAILFGVSH